MDMLSHLQLLLVAAAAAPTLAVVNVPGVEFNAATGQAAHASSYYDYRPNPVRDVAFVPQNAIDGFADESSWWSSGEEVNASVAGRVFWQLNLTAAPPALKRIVVRWHGFLTPASFKVRVSLMGENFQTIAAVANRPIEYDRVDVITAKLDTVDTRFRFVRVAIDTPNTCADAYACTLDGGGRANQTNERVIYGIREFELWATGTKNAAARRDSNSWRWLLVFVSALWVADVGI
jgi:hypothetical protein